jgi:hypothetical protein
MRVVAGLGALIWILAALCGAATGADKQPEPLDILRQLKDRMYVVGETTGRQEDYMAAIENARRELQNYGSSGGDPAAFVRSDNGSTPLIMAASAGYADIVAELLKNEHVATAVNDLDQNGISAWAYANFALNEAIWVCNPTVFKNPFSFVPKLVTLPYYLGGAERPYPKTPATARSSGRKKRYGGGAAALARYLQTCDG